MISSFVITGFLGVGKTTMLVNSVQKHFQNKKVAIIVNEFGEVGVDSKILKNVHSEVMEISEGCICCQLATEFESGVREIIHMYSPDMILVETSGASEPFPIFLSLQNLGINVEGVICVVDSKNFDTYKDNSSAKYQLGGSNIIVLNKTDLVTQNELTELEKEIAAIKEEYNIKNTLTGEAIFNNHIVYKAKQGVVPSEVFNGIYNIEEVINYAKEDKHHDHTIKDAISQKVVYIKKDVMFSQVDEVLNNIPDNIYRVKGVIKTNDVSNAIFVNYSFGDVVFDEVNDYKEDSVLILIGEDIDKSVEILLEQFDILHIPMFRLNK
jgi:G3E family GTPase